MTYGDGTEIVFRNFCTQNLDGGESPKRKKKTSTTRRILAIKTALVLCVLCALSASLFLILYVSRAIYEVYRFET